MCILSYNCVLHYELLAGSGGVLSFFVEERRGEKEKQLSYDERQDIFCLVCALFAAMLQKIIIVVCTLSVVLAV